MAHKVRIDLPSEVSLAVEKAIRAALEACPEEEPWEVAVLQDLMAPDMWEAVAAGPKVDPGGEWEVLVSSGRWSRSPNALYTRLFDGPDEHDPDYIHHTFHELFRCFQKASP